MFSLHTDTARTWRGGQNQVLLTVNGLRASGERAALVAHPDGELRRRATEGLELIPIAPRTEMDLAAAWRLSRVVKRLAPDVIHAHDPSGTILGKIDRCPKLLNARHWSCSISSSGRASNVTIGRASAPRRESAEMIARGFRRRVRVA